MRLLSFEEAEDFLNGRTHYPLAGEPARQVLPIAECSCSQHSRTLTKHVAADIAMDLHDRHCVEVAVRQERPDVVEAVYIIYGGAYCVPRLRSFVGMKFATLPIAQYVCVANQRAHVLPEHFHITTSPK